MYSDPGMDSDPGVCSDPRMWSEPGVCSDPGLCSDPGMVQRPYPRLPILKHCSLQLAFRLVLFMQTFSIKKHWSAQLCPSPVCAEPCMYSDPGMYVF